MNNTDSQGLAARPVRSLIYLPILRMGLTDQDWMFVLIGGVVGYAIPYVLGLTILHIPLELITMVIFVMASIAAMNLLRLKKKPLYLKHFLRNLTRSNIRPRYASELTENWIKG